VSDKHLQWVGSSRADVRAFPRDARRLAGFQLRRVQQGLEPTDWKEMRAVGPGVRDIDLARQRYRELARQRQLKDRRGG
jgi:phage-related protein